MNQVEEFNQYRELMNSKILAEDNKVLKRIFNLDTNAFSEGALDIKIKEIIGLACSLVLRCDDCVKFHLGKCHEVGFSREEMVEALSIGVLIGGTITIPHLRRAVEYIDSLENV